MKFPILARVSRSARLVGDAVRALVAPPLTTAGATDFQGGAFFVQRRMSPQEVRWTLERAAQGDLQAQWELFALMEDTWPRLAKNLAELRRAAARACYVVQPYAERGQQASAMAKDKAATVDRAMRQWWPKPGTLELSFEDTLFHALDAYGKGISALEIHWQATPVGLLPRCSHVLAARRYGWNAEATELGLLNVNGFQWQSFPQDHFFVGIWQARTGAPGATAVLRALAPYWAGITFGWEWLLSNAQIFGVPFRWANFDRNQPGLGAQVRDMLAAMGACGYGAFPDGTKLEFKEVSQNVTGNPQVVVQDIANQACDLLILGQELSGSAQKAGLGGGAADLQENVRADRLKAVAQWCADLLNYQLVPGVLRANYGNTDEPPTIAPDLEADPKPLDMAQRDKVFLDAGIDLPRSWFYQRHSIPEPSEGETVISGRAPVAPMDPAALASAQRSVQARQSEGSLAAYVAGSVRRAAPEVRRALDPVLRRMAEISAIEDVGAQRAALEKFRAEFPVIARETLAHVPAAAAVFQEIIGPAFLSGFAEAAQSKKP